MACVLSQVLLDALGLPRLAAPQTEPGCIGCGVSADHLLHRPPRRAARWRAGVRQTNSSLVVSDCLLTPDRAAPPHLPTQLLTSCLPTSTGRRLPENWPSSALSQVPLLLVALLAAAVPLDDGAGALPAALRALDAGVHGDDTRAQARRGFDCFPFLFSWFSLLLFVGKHVVFLPCLHL